MPSLFLRRRFFTGLFLTLFPLQTIIRKYASVAELVDAQDLGSCAFPSVERPADFFIAVKTPFDNALPAKGVYFKTGYDFEIGYKEIL